MVISIDNNGNVKLFAMIMYFNKIELDASQVIKNRHSSCNDKRKSYYT